ncbi:MAG: dihydroorotase [Saprospiraceae bacterium]|nr:dihydroorotase [Saprospiraceae bacterium]
MQLLIRKATIVSPGSKHHNKERDILIKNGSIQEIKARITPKGKVEVFEAKGAFVSPGWMDVGAMSGDPGFEYREDLNSLKAAASVGGFTRLAVLPNTDPVIDSKSEVSYLMTQNGKSLVDIHPIGAASVHCEGKDIAEYYDMHSEGAIGFSDGEKPVQHSGLMMRALLYAKSFGGVVLNSPHDASIAPGGQMHEGKVSTSMGLTGLPDLAEHLMLERDLELLRHTESRLHVLNISSKGSLRRIRQAKKSGLDVSASVPALNLLLIDKAVEGFDVMTKVTPPLREEGDRKALLKGLKDGTLDLVSSNHRPLEVEAKNVEFPRAEFGSIGLESCYPVVQTAFEGGLDPEDVFEIFCQRPRNIFGLSVPEIAQGEPAELTIFNCQEEWTLGAGHLLSKSQNTPLIGHSFLGKVLGTIHNGEHFFYQ